MNKKKYHVYGIGNALVDIEYQVSEEQLQQLAIDKGVMTLVSTEAQHKLMTELADGQVHRSCGGSAANTVIASQQFGGHGYYSCKVASDEIGRFYLQDLLQHGVRTNLVGENLQHGVTGTCLVFVTPDTDRTMCTHLGVTGDIGLAELSAEAIADSAYVYMEGYLASSKSGCAAAVEARRLGEASGALIAMTLSDPNMVEHFKDGLLAMLGNGVDLLFSNESEAKKLAGTTDLTTALEHLKTISKQFALTRGAQGVILYDGKELIELDAVKVEAVDTVGAGDMFAGAFLYGLTHGLDFSQAGKLGASAAAKLVTQFGPRLPNPEVHDLLRTFNQRNA